MRRETSQLDRGADAVASELAASVLSNRQWLSVPAHVAVPWFVHISLNGSAEHECAVLLAAANTRKLIAKTAFHISIALPFPASAKATMQMAHKR